MNSPSSTAMNSCASLWKWWRGYIPSVENQSGIHPFRPRQFFRLRASILSSPRSRYTVMGNLELGTLPSPNVKYSSTDMLDLMSFPILSTPELMIYNLVDNLSSLSDKFFRSLLVHIHSATTYAQIFTEKFPAPCER
ncbi:hypothetical protein CHELA40_13798 [Chelatococcus asaccharovorans]|nr:hypothetical protein CHELA40_13798 [Chelatococcus asaccharovorans]CAH1675557.1 hypothetical protein CHELA17_61828 [Chelatococcus asaccharovorans]